jgi:hypothetical protein
MNSSVLRILQKSDRKVMSNFGESWNVLYRLNIKAAFNRPIPTSISTGNPIAIA